MRLMIEGPRFPMIVSIQPDQAVPPVANFRDEHLVNYLATSTIMAIPLWLWFEGRSCLCCMKLLFDTTQMIRLASLLPTGRIHVMATKRTRVIDSTPVHENAAKQVQSPSAVNVQALPFSYNDTAMYLCVISVQTLFPLCMVSRADENPEAGYQRLLSDTRSNEIARYIDDGRVIPGAVILSAQNALHLKYDEGSRSLTFQPIPGGFLVIDGQHRLYGAHRANENVPLCVCILTGLSLREEVQYFLDINGNQRGVPRTLEIEVLKFVDEKGSVDDIRGTLFRELNTRPESPLCGRLSATKSVPGKLTHVPFQRALTPLLQTPPLSTLSMENKFKLLVNLLQAIEKILADSLGDARKLTNTAFFEAFFGAFRDIEVLAHGTYGNYKPASFEAVLRPLENIDWARFSGTNQQNIRALTIHIQELVNRRAPISDSML